MIPLREYFGPEQCKNLKARFGIDYVEQAQVMSDQELLKCRSIGVGFCRKLRMIHTDVTQPPDAVPLRKRNTTVVVTGLNPRQRNALVRAFSEGKINTIINSYMEDMFITDRVTVIPTWYQHSDRHKTTINYLNEN